MLSPGLIIGLDASHLEIPSDFTRVTILDGRFPKGAIADADGGDNGGSPVHAHTSPAHVHVLPSHTHPFTLSGWNNYNFTSSNKSSIPSETDKSVHDGHYHTGESAAATSTTNPTALTYGPVSNNPPYYELIFIRANNYSFIPSKGVTLSAQTARPGLAFHGASAGRFWRGAPTDGDAGGVGGSLVNIHDISHGHVANPHSHTAVSSGASYLDRHGYGPSGNRIGNHQHSFTFNATTVPITDLVASLETPETVQPAHRTLNAFKNISGGKLLAQPGDIVLFIGPLENIPIGWLLCDGENGTPDMRAQFLKIPASAAASIMGGANTHSHSAQSHQHTTAQHNHTKGSLTDYAQTYSADNTGEGGDLAGGGAHNVSISNANPAYGAANTTADVANNEPEYVTVLFVQMAFLPIVGAGIVTRR